MRALTGEHNGLGVVPTPKIIFFSIFPFFTVKKFHVNLRALPKGAYRYVVLSYDELRSPVLRTLTVSAICEHHHELKIFDMYID